VLSPILFCLYIDELLVALSRAGVGCFMGSNFVGALAYADDIVLLAPSASALRMMPVICDNYAKDYSISFNASKSKCLKVLSDILLATDDGNLSALALLDLSAAFDTVDHDTLLRRLDISYRLNRTVLNWVGSYLIGRRRRVRIGSTFSAPSFHRR